MSSESSRHDDPAYGVVWPLGRRGPEERGHATQADEPLYKVVWPLGRMQSEELKISSPISDLNGKTVCEVWDRQFRGDEIFPVIREKLKERYPGVRFVGHEAFGNTHGPDEKQVLAALPEKLRNQGCDVAISAVGA